MQWAVIDQRSAGRRKSRSRLGKQRRTAPKAMYARRTEPVEGERVKQSLLCEPVKCSGSADASESRLSETNVGFGPWALAM